MRCLKSVSGEMHRVLSFFFIFYFFTKQTLGYRSYKIMLADFRDLGLIVFILLSCLTALSNNTSLQNKVND